MNRATVGTAALALGAIAAAATIAPALAAPASGSAHPAVHARAIAKAIVKAAPARTATQVLQVAAAAEATSITSQMDKGKYLTLVQCQGTTVPPPIKLAQPGIPLTASGTGPSPAMLTGLQQPGEYHTVYSCTVVVKEKVPPKPKPSTCTAGTRTGTRTGTPMCTPKATPKAIDCMLPNGQRRYGNAKCGRKVTLNTGFGGMAPRVRLHHPAD